MSIFKCKMCGGTIEFEPGATIGVCDSCGTKQTLPRLDSDRKTNLFDRANHFRRNNDFDKAIAVYEQILNEDKTDAEAYWSLVLCRYGIEYVEDPATHKRIPTINRSQFTSIFADEDYKSAIEYADDAQKEIYEAEAHAIDKIQKGILKISSKESPFDIFICYKETDPAGNRTPDSVLAQDLYFQLKQEGFKVFFARITLEDKLGSAYEPYIFAALNSAKVMVVLGTKPEYFNAVWVKNEWNRYLALVKNSEGKKVLIPAYKDMDPYDLPDEFSHLQAQDMSKLGFMQDLIRGIKKILNVEPDHYIPKEQKFGTNNTNGLVKRTFLFLEDGDYTSANEYAEKVLDQDPECAEIYIAKLMVELRLRKPTQLKNCDEPLTRYPNYQRAMQFATGEYAATVREYNDAILERLENNRKEAIYQEALKKSSASGLSDQILLQCIGNLQKIENYKDAKDQIAILEAKLEKWKQEKAAADENARIRAEEARLAALRKAEQDRIKAERAKQRARKAAIIGIPSLIMVALVFVLIFKLIIPTIHYNQADKLLSEGRYEEAMQMYASLGGFKDSKNKETVISSIEEIKEERSEESIETSIQDILNAGTPVQISYDMGGGDFSGTSTLSNGSVIVLANLLSTGNHISLANSEANSTPSDQPVTKVFYSASDFSGLEVPGRNGYHFVKWKVDTCAYRADKKTDIVEIALVAIWNIKSYTITYDLAGGDEIANVQAYNTEDNSFTLNNPSRAGYTFIGWTGTDCAEPSLSVTIPTGSLGNRSYQANWQANTYTITLNSNGGTASYASQTVVYDDAFSLPTPTWEGHTFSGWYYGNQKQNGQNYSFTADVTFIARWDVTNYKITYVLNNGTNAANPATYTIYDTVLLSDPSRTGYTFTGWTYSGHTTPTKNITISAGTTGEKTYTANWQANIYTATLNANSGSVSVPSMDATYDSDYTLPTPTRTGYTFSGWYNGNTKYTSGSTWKTASSITLTAKWTARTDIAYQVKHYQQNVNDDDYTLYATQALQGTADANVTPSVNNYTGFTSPSSQTVSVKPDGTLVVNYYYTRNLYTVTMVVNGGDAISAITQKYQSALAMPTATRENYTFGGWFTDATLSTPFTQETVGLSSLTVYAWWTEENKPADFTYSGSSALTVSAYTGTSETMWIPSYIGGNPVTTIPASAFQNKTLITNVVVPETVTSIGGSAFKGCNSIVEITLPFVGESASATISERSVFGFVFGSTQNGTPRAKTSSGMTSQNDWIYNYTNYYIPQSIREVTITTQKTIPIYAFMNCDLIESITLPPNAMSIGNYAFYYCSALKAIEIPESVASIGSYAFQYCTELTTVSIPNGIQHISDYAFSGCSSIKRINSNNDGELIIPALCETLGVGAFQNLVLVTTVVVPETVTSIGEATFSGCNSIVDITLPFVGDRGFAAGSYADHTVFGYIFGRGSTSGVITTRGKTSTSDLTDQGDTTSNKIGFKIPTTIRSVTITVQTKLSANAFYNCDLIESITLPTNTTSIGKNAFYNCTALKRFNSDSDRELNIPIGVTAIGQYAFYNCCEVVHVTTSDQVLSIGDYAFSGCSSIERFNSETAGELIVPTSCETIGTYAFQKLALITKVIVRESVTNIGNCAFNGCNSIEEITLPFVGNHLTSKTTFGYIFGAIPTTIRIVTITEQAEIPADAFKNCNLIEFLTLPTNATSIGNYAFYNCSALKRINSNSDGEFNIPIGVTAIGQYAFYNCYEAVHVTTSDQVLSIGSYAFSGCTSITRFHSETDGELIVPTSCETIGTYAFQNLALITRVVVPETATSIGEAAFKGCNSITDITLPFVGNRAKPESEYNYKNLFGFIFGNNGTSNAAGTVRQNYNASYYYYFFIPATIKSVTITAQANIPAYAFHNCTGLEQITLLTDAVTTNTASFNSCSATLTLTLTHSDREPWDGTSVSTGFRSGTGTETDPYIIACAAEFAYFAEQVNAGNNFDGKFILLTCDVNLNSASMIIGSAGHPFSGVFNGGGHAIKNAVISTDAEYAGLFGYCNGTIRNLSITNISITSTCQATNAYVAPIAYLSENGLIEQVYATGTVTGNCGFSAYVGGLVGYAKGTVNESYSNCTVTATSTNYIAYAGGLIGYLENGTLTDCFATGNVTANGSNDAYSRNGGLVGNNTSESTITNCYRSSAQTLTKYSATGSYNAEGISASIADIVTDLCKTSWDADIWNFVYEYPIFL